MANFILIITSGLIRIGRLDEHEGWNRSDIPSLHGKFAIVTGGTGGLGYETSLALAVAGAKVILLGRNEIKGKSAVVRILSIHPLATGMVSFQRVDLCSLSSVKEFANSVNNSCQAIDILVNNAGVCAPPRRELTSDNFELQMGTNHLAHFALTAHLLPSLRRSCSPRVVNVSSLLSWMTKAFPLDICDLKTQKQNQDQNQHRGYRFTFVPLIVYGQSKLANQLFTQELQRRSDENGWGLTVTCAHPGVSKTDLVANGVGEQSLFGFLYRATLGPLFEISVGEGALPILFAATSPIARKGGYYGPGGLFGLRMGARNVRQSRLSQEAKDPKLGKELWEASEQLCQVAWNKA